MSFACTDCFGPHNIEKRIMVKKAVKRYRSNNLKNDYESEEINSQDSEHYLQPHFMDGYIKRDDYLYITTGYLQFDKTLLYSSAEDSSDEEDYDPNARTPRLHQWRHSKYRVNFLVGRQLKQFVDIITMNAVHHTKYEHVRVLDVHFIKAQQSDDSSDSDSDVTATSAKRQRI
jgi:hypothetical protein